MPRCLQTELAQDVEPEKVDAQKLTTRNMKVPVQAVGLQQELVAQDIEQQQVNAGTAPARNIRVYRSRRWQPRTLNEGMGAAMLQIQSDRGCCPGVASRKAEV